MCCSAVSSRDVFILLAAWCRLTSDQWQPLLEQNVPVVKDMNLKVDESAIHEELNLAWAGKHHHAAHSHATQLHTSGLG